MQNAAAFLPDSAGRFEMLLTAHGAWPNTNAPCTQVPTRIRSAAWMRCEVGLAHLRQAGDGPPLLRQQVGGLLRRRPRVARQTLDQNCCLHVSQSATLRNVAPPSSAVNRSAAESIRRTPGRRSITAPSSSTQMAAVDERCAGVLRAAARQSERIGVAAEDRFVVRHDAEHELLTRRERRERGARDLPTRRASTPIDRVRDVVVVRRSSRPGHGTTRRQPTPSPDADDLR